VNQVHAGFWSNVEWLRKYRLKIAIAIGIAIAIDCGIERGRRDSDSDPDRDSDPEHDRERFSTLIRDEPLFVQAPISEHSGVTACRLHALVAIVNCHSAQSQNMQGVREENVFICL